MGEGAANERRAADVAIAGAKAVQIGARRATVRTSGRTVDLSAKVGAEQCT
jgi:adenine C2-methylase RlmN of 23S rRNA A2503 and tRNA A37